MDIGGVSSSMVQSVLNSNAGNVDAVTVKVLNKARDIQEQTAAQLIEALPDPQSNLGRNVDTFA